MQPIIFSNGTATKRTEQAQSFANELLTNDSGKFAEIDFKIYEVLEGKKSISIDQVRDLIREVNIKPRSAQKKVAWIKEAQALTEEAQNALLKILEEPPAYSQIILTVDHPSNLIDTVLSRCLVKDLVLSTRVETDTDEYIQARKGFLNLLKLNIGQKVDWVSENKDLLKNREEVLSLLDTWESILRDEMLKAIKNSSNKADELKEKIKLIQKIKSFINGNANTSLAVEALLINL